MYLRPEDRAKPNRMAWRIAAVGGACVVLFAILFFRLWTLQVLDGAGNLAEAKNNRTRSLKIVAPRGKILMRNGDVLVDNRTSLALQVDTTKLPEDPAERTAELKELGELVHMKLPRVEEVIAEEEKVAAGAPITLRRDVGYDVVYYLQERQGKFPGVAVEKVFVRNYPDEGEAAQVVGHVGEVSEEELKEEGPYKGFEPGEIVGKEGLEYTYDDILRGAPGTSRYQVNALGVPTPGGQLTSTPPEPGNNLKLTINPAVQAAGEAALAERGLPGAFVTMNIHSGEILGIGSAPTYDPSIWSKTISDKQAEYLFQSEAKPLFNRATESAYPTGSIYKIITALAALEHGVITGDTVIQDNGSIEVGEQKFENSEGAVNGPVSLVHALQVSSDVFFYELGRKMNGTNWLQQWSSELGIGRSTGVDVPVSELGNVPSKKWRDELFAEGETDRPWSVGDNVQLAVGQGDLQTDPLQMAVAYSALGNGGTIVTPHLALEVQDAAGRAIREIDPGPRRHVDIDPHSRDLIMEGLHEAAQVPGGTAAALFEDFPVEVAGKTGTAERGIVEPNQSWFVSLAPYPNPNIVTVVTVENGGFGAEAAAPANKQILEAYFSGELKKASDEETEEEPLEEESAEEVPYEEPLEELPLEETGEVE